MVVIDKRLLVVSVIIIVAAAAFASYYLYEKSLPVRIGVLLPLTGDVELREPLEWAKDEINNRGGIGGRHVDLVYADTGLGNNTTLLARKLLADDSIRIVIGPPTSDDVFSLTPDFIRQEKLLISPLATSGDIIRAYGKKGYFWRTTQGDVAQVKTIIAILNEKGVRRAALLAENTTYGGTFYEWAGFFGTEYGLDIPFVGEFEPGSCTLERDVSDALRTNPEYIIAACGPADAASIKQAIDRSGKPVRLFLADAAATPMLVSALGSAAEGLEGTSPTADPASGFNAAYQDRFGRPPTDYAGPTYDALLLAVYTSARQQNAPSEPLADSIRHVIYGNGTPRTWMPGDSCEAIRDLLSGGSPSVSGASGPLEYDVEFGVDPLVTYFSYWVIRNGEYQVVETRGYEKAGTAGSKGESIARTRASTGFMALPADSTTERFVPGGPRTGFKAVIIGPSPGWNNYRHQSDALAVYDLLRKRGVPDEDIILMVYDDVAFTPENPVKGDIHNTVGGANLREGATVDYTGSRITGGTLRNVLLGIKTYDTPVVLESDTGTDLFVYIASHALPGRIVFGNRNESISSEDFTGIVRKMEQEGRYRQMIVVADTCFGESIAQNSSAKGFLFFTGAKGNEPSFGAVYDISIRQWLSDEFTSSILGSIQADPDITIRELYIAAYERVSGSHVRLLNVENFGSIDTGIIDFLSPSRFSVS